MVILLPSAPEPDVVIPISPCIESSESAKLILVLLSESSLIFITDEPIFVSTYALVAAS